MADSIETAIRRLIENHRSEFDDLLHEEASKAGELSRVPFMLSIIDTLVEYEKEQEEDDDT
jgi:hypothetical protein